MKIALTLALALATLVSTSAMSTAQESKKTDGKKADAKTETMTIVEVASSNKDFSTLVAAVKAAGLVDTLSGKGPFTVFAPTNAAFEALPEGTVATLLKPENKKQLTDVLTYHVVSGKVMAADVTKLDEAKSVQGQSLKIDTSGSGVKVNNAKLVKTDIVCKNGVIHVIDAVLLPSSK